MSEYKNEAAIAVEIGLALSELVKNVDAKVLSDIRNKMKAKRRISNEELLEIYADGYDICINALNEYIQILLGQQEEVPEKAEYYEEVSNFNEEGIVEEPEESLEDIEFEPKNPSLRSFINEFVSNYKKIKDASEELKEEIDEELEKVEEDIEVKLID